MLIDDISRGLELPVNYLEQLAASASYRYKRYAIPKKSGGLRQISHPARELKLVQSWLIANVLNKLPVHNSATAYRSGSSILRNAAQHSMNNFLLKIDFRDFFPSLTRTDVAGVLTAASHGRGKVLELTPADIHFVTSIVCCKGALAIGAPSSPSLSNAIMFDFDQYWSKRCSEMNVTYTRYADDSYFSTRNPNVLSDLLKSVEAYLSNQPFPKLRINHEKTVFTSRKRLRKVTGLVLTSDRKISIGRHQKRILKSMVLKLIKKELNHVQTALLQGWIAYVRSVEPAFIVSMQRKYSIDFEKIFLLPKSIKKRPR